MKTKFYFLLSMAYLLVQVSVFGQTYVPDEDYVLWCNPNTNDTGFIQLLEADGYLVSVQRGAYEGEWTATELDSANDARIIFIGRGAGSGNYSNTDGGVTGPVNMQWADVEAPVVALSPFCIRSNKQMWVNSTNVAYASGVTGANGDNIVIPSSLPNDFDFFFEGATPVNDTIVFYEPNDTLVNSDCFSLSQDVGNGTMIAADSGNTGVVIAMWEDGVPYYAASLTPASTRVYFSAGTSDCGGEACGPNSIMNLSDEGKAMFLNMCHELAPHRISAVKEHSVLNPFSMVLSPVPAVDVLKASWVSSYPGETSIQIVDITGKVVMEQPYQLVAGQNVVDVNISALAAGTYLAKIKMANGQAAKKFNVVK